MLLYDFYLFQVEVKVKALNGIWVMDGQLASSRIPEFGLSFSALSVSDRCARPGFLRRPT